MYSFRRKKTFGGTLWKLRYRFYSIIFILILLPLMYADRYGIKPNVEILVGAYEIQETNLLASKIQPSTIEILERQDFNSKYSAYINENGAFEFRIRSELDLDLDSRSLNNFIPIPENPTLVNFLQYPKYNVSAPILYATVDDMYETNPDGSVKLDQNKSQITKDTNSTDSPVQLKLREGVVHLVFSPEPGEYFSDTKTGCYIIGHSSNYSFIKSDYNTVFAPLKQKTQVGETFIIYDRFGRKLNFRVFESLKIAEEDVQTAYKPFPGRRVCTLQTSILGWRNGRLEATHRWLTRGYLVDEQGGEIPA